MDLEKKEAEVIAARDATVVSIGNLVHDSVPVSDDEVRAAAGGSQGSEGQLGGLLHGRGVVHGAHRVEEDIIVCSSVARGLQGLGQDFAATRLPCCVYACLCACAAGLYAVNTPATECFSSGIPPLKHPAQCL